MNLRIEKYPPTKGAMALKELEKPEVDDRKYHQFFLQNGIPVTLVSDNRFEVLSFSQLFM